MRYNYIDTSYLAPYYLPEPSSDSVENKLRALSPAGLFISHLVRTEFASLLSRKCREKEMDGRDARRCMGALDRHLEEGRFRMTSVQARDFDQAAQWILAMQYPLRAPDALHLAIATRVDAVFWTLDKTLAKAAKWVGLKVQK